MNDKQKENEKNCPDLVKLRKIALDENETSERKYKAAWCYYLMAMSLKGY